MVVMQASNISRSYDNGRIQLCALKNVSLTISEKSFMTISGPSGSGKSTLLNILGLLDQPSSGQLTLQNQVMTYDDFDKMARLRSRYLSFIFQTFNLIPVLDAFENVMLPLTLHHQKTTRQRAKQVEKWLKAVDLWEHRRHFPEELSGGQKQRVSIARAMVTEPKLVLADEPTANLDSKTANHIIKLMQEVNQNERCAFVFSTHDPKVKSFARERWEIQDGVLHQEQS